jgi:hypothetical protein
MCSGIDEDNDEDRLECEDEDDDWRDVGIGGARTCSNQNLKMVCSNYKA